MWCPLLLSTHTIIFFSPILFGQTRYFFDKSQIFGLFNRVEKEEWDIDFAIFCYKGIKISKLTMPSTLIAVEKYFRGVQTTKVFVIGSLEYSVHISRSPCPP